MPKSEAKAKLRDLKSKFDNECLEFMEKITAEYERFYINLQEDYLEKCSSKLGLSIKDKGRK